MKNTTKTILFASLIIAMILPFSTMDYAVAEKNNKCPQVNDIGDANRELRKLDEKATSIAKEIKAEEDRLVALAKKAYDSGDIDKARAGLEMAYQVLPNTLAPIQECGKAIEDKLTEMKKQGDTTNIIYEEDTPITFVGSPTQDLDFDMDKVHIDCGLNWNTFHTDGTYMSSSDEFNMDNNTWPSTIKGFNGWLQCVNKSYSNPVTFTIAKFSSGFVVCIYDAYPSGVNSEFDTSCSNSFEDISYTVTMTTTYVDENRPTMSKLITLS